MDEFSSGDQAPEWTSSSSDDSFSYEDEDSHQDVENIDNVESSIEKDDDKVTATMLWSSEFDKEVHAYKAYVNNIVHCVAKFRRLEVDDGKDPKRAFALWYGSLWSGSIWMNFLVAKTTPTYRHTIGCVNGIIKDLEKRLCLVENVSRPVKDIQDLEIVKIRGAPKLNKKFKGLKTRNCSRCGQTGHTRRTCHNVESEKHCLTGDNGSEGEGHGSRFETGRHNSHDDDVAAKQGSLSSKFGLYSAEEQHINQVHAMNAMPSSSTSPIAKVMPFANAMYSNAGTDVFSFVPSHQWHFQVV
ncbi:hypothetical protein S83_063729 [Arachis hypogaea]